MREIYKQYIELGHVLGVTSVHLVDQPDLFKIGNLVYGGREIVLNVYSRNTHSHPAARFILPQ